MVASLSQIGNPPAGASEARLLISFVDLTNFTLTARGQTDRTLAAFTQRLYEQVSGPVDQAGGRVVKFIGDAALIVFPEEKADQGIRCLLDLKRSVDRWLDSVGYRGRLVVKAHLGSAIEGEFGPRDRTRYDIIGADVNLTATLQSQGFAISPQAFRALSSESRKHFKKHTPPVTYIPVEHTHGTC